ncbi:TerB N-terminal domain-containing protein [Nocardiopsis sp. YSL2]|uniref:TerB N-terminal domain-containing protein n=1 Tax=Nocardiopsis sp. YSL2 TaxID=2939492 RepID=UPI0026F42AFB|nr:TerB N-terminal domain-containing protein [Nocardiopsis sp. YSL2]
MRFSFFEKAASKRNTPTSVREGTHGLVWYPVGAAMNVRGTTVQGGLLYLKDSDSSVEGSTGMIESELPVGSSRRPAFNSGSPPNRPVPYRELHEDARAHYLQWLVDGRDARGVESGFVLNYFCGLERRAFHLMQRGEGTEELVSIASEIRRLSARYAIHGVLVRRSEELLRVLEVVPAGARESWRFTGAPLPGQRTYDALHRASAHVHYGAPEASPALSQVAVAPSVPETDGPSVTSPGTAAEVRTEEKPTAGDGFIDRELLATIQQDNAASDRLLDTLFEEDEESGEPDPLESVTIPPTAPQEGEERDPLSGPLRLLLAGLADKGECSRSEAADRARELGLMLNAALTEINEFAEERCDAEVVYEDEELVVVDAQVFEDLELPELEAQAPMTSPPLPPSAPTGEPATATDSELPPTPEPAPGADTAPVGPPRWISSIETVRVQGRSISDGMFYYGVPVDRKARLEVVDATLPADTGSGGRPTRDEVAAYADLSPGARGEFLDWLKAGRPVSSARESFLVLLLHGLEHRALVDLKPHRQSRDNLTELLSYLHFLISDYSSHEGFVRSAGSFAAVLERLAMDERDIFSSQNTGPSSKMTQQVLQFKLGMYACTGRPLPLELVVFWVRMHPFTAKNPEVQRTREFHRAFRKRFVQTLPNGLRLSKELPDLQWSYRPAHPSLGVFPVPTGKAKMVWDHFPTLQTLGMISSKALDDCAKPGAALPAPNQKKAKEADRTIAPVKQTRPLPAPEQQPEPPAVPSVPRKANSVTRRWSTWKSPGTEVSIGGMHIPDGMLYTGYGPGKDMGAPDLQSASSLDINCAVQRPDVETIGAVSDTVRSYAALSSQQRWHYLRWLQNRHRCQGIPPVFVRLYLQGLERRLVDLVGKHNPRIQTSNPVLAELKRLRSGFAHHRGTVSYVDGLLELARVVQDQAPQDPPRFDSGALGTPFSLLHGVGAAAAEGRPLRADWAVEWVALHVRPENLEHFRAGAKRALAGVSVAWRIGREVPRGLPDLVFTYRPRCPDLGEQDVVLEGVPDLTGVEPPQKLVDRILPTQPSPVSNPPVQTDTPIKQASLVPEEPCAPTAAAKEGRGWQETRLLMSAWAGLAVEMSRHSGELTVHHRVAVMRGVLELGDAPLARVRNWQLHRLEDQSGEPETQVRALVNTPLPRRERAGDLLLDLLDLTASTTPEQLSFLLAVHQGLGLEAVFRLRLSYRGLAPDPAGNGAMGATWKPRKSTRHRTAAPARVAGLSQVQARLLSDLAQVRTWSLRDVERLAAWYGMAAHAALDALSEAASKLIRTDVLVRQGDVVTVRVEQVKEMTK